MPGTPSSPGPDPFPTCVGIVGQQAERPRLFPTVFAAFQIWKQPACLRSVCLTVWRHLHGLLCRPSAWNTAAAPVQMDVQRGGWTAASHLPL